MFLFSAIKARFCWRFNTQLNLKVPLFRVLAQPRPFTAGSFGETGISGAFGSLAKREARRNGLDNVAANPFTA
jgi:hypothetical protein